MRKIIKIAIIVLIIVICLIGILIFIPLPFPITGKKIGTVAVECTLSEDETTLSIKAANYSSMGYIKSYKAKQDGDKLYITFYLTFGLNNPNGAKNSFDIDITDINFLYYYHIDEYKLIWQRY